ncbi:MAG: formate dehydrogenase accessory sulfurtransferase FdhD [bacterium]
MADTRRPPEYPEHPEHPEGVKQVQAERISTGETVQPPATETVTVIHETPLTLDVEGIETYTLLCTPTDRQALAVGFLYTEGVIDSPADIDVIKACDDDPDTIRVRLKDEVPRLDDAGRNLLIVSSCGACGSENLQERIKALPQVGDTLRIAPSLLRTVFATLRQRQVLFKASGGAHAAALFDDRGEIVAFAEDSGRHNALDKAFGKCLLAGGLTSGLGVALTSRLSLEMVTKCARAGIEIVAAVSAPTTLAIEVATTCNITLCAFVRETRATAFSRAARIVQPE